MLEITIPFPPRTKKNSQQIVYNQKTRRRFIVQSPAWKEYERLCLGTKTRPGFLIQFGKMICYDVPVHLQALYYLDTNRKTDLAGLIQGTQDLLQDAGIIQDDALVVSLDGSRIMGKDAKNPRVEITIAEMP